MNNTGEFKIKFRGIRGSHPIPSINMMKYGGNTSCIEVRVNGYTIIIDAGTGIIELGNELVKSYIASGTDERNRTPIETLMLFSHAHQDHIHGFPFFKPAYIGSSKIHMFGTKNIGMDFIETLSNSMFTPYFPIHLGEMAAQLNINNFTETQMIVLHKNYNDPIVKKIYDSYNEEIPQDAVIITCQKSYAHPKDGVLCYKIFWNGISFVYASDKESYIGGDSRLSCFARNTDLLIHDSQYLMEDYSSPIIPKQGYGHSTPEMATEAAKLSNAKKLVLFHLDPSYDDNTVKRMEEIAVKHFPNTIAAYEGLEIDLLETN